jgi:SAM-dependent methyltransferase
MLDFIVHNKPEDIMKLNRAKFDLFLASALGLFVELMVIRWLSSELRMLAFYKNFALIATFLGMGLGFAVTRRKGAYHWYENAYFIILAAVVILVLALGRTFISEAVLLNRANTAEFIWAGSKAAMSPLVTTMLDISFYALTFILFVSITVLFIPLGNLIAQKFNKFNPLPGYTINILGSMAGILIYTVISFFGWSPWTWFLISGVAGLYLLWNGKLNTHFLLNALLALTPILLTLLWPTGSDRTIWSPYYRIDIDPVYSENDPDLNLGYELSVNQAWHQRMWNLGKAFVDLNYDTDPLHFKTNQSQYDTPFMLGTRLDDVLIVGAGTGNDVAAAQRAGAKNIVAVEIDPVIFEMGEELHPEDPYDSGKGVIQVTEDARSFFRSDTHKYDLIVFGLLDSHTLFSTASSLRIDNFVYTVESLKEVRSLLKVDGLLVLSFGIPDENNWVGLRLYKNLTNAFGHAPQTYEYLSGNIVFLIGQKPITDALIQNPLVVPRLDYTYLDDLPETTDDWPYLYLRDRAIPTTYIIALIGIILISYLFVRRLLPDFGQFNPHFFFMGTAFFLLETKSITEIALLLGSTWIVNAAVIAAILLMIVLANIIVEKKGLTNPKPLYALLALTLVFNYFVPIGNLLGFTLIWRIILASLMQAIPLFFAGMIFAITFSQTKSIEIALGSNMLGSVLGGISEYSSLILGIRFLYLFALLFYILSALPIFRSPAVRKSASF